MENFTEEQFEILEIKATKIRKLLLGTLLLAKDIWREELKEKTNVMTASWQMPVSFRPTLVAIAVGHKRFSHRLILESREFAINVPHSEMMKEVWCCGAHSGRNMDKFEFCNITPLKAQKIGSPLIKECIGNIECRLHAHHKAGDHTIFVGEVIASSVKEGLFDKNLRVDIEEAKTLHHLGGKAFCTTGPIKGV